MRYAELPNGDAAGLFGADDLVGSLNKQTPAAVAYAAGLVRTGEIFPLNAPLNWPDPPLYSRKPLQHTVYQTPLGNRDDFLDSFYPQASSQWDGFAHIADPEVGFYNRKQPSELGIQAWAERGIAGRGVLLDVRRFLGASGREIHWRSDYRISIDELEQCRRAGKIEKRDGDILLLRTGWTQGYQGATTQERADVRADPTSPGLADGRAMLEYLWDWGISAIASDNISVEALPGRDAPLHPHLLNRLGIPIGELWQLEHLAQHCADDGRYEFLLTSAPLNLPGGIGSPANAIALK